MLPIIVSFFCIYISQGSVATQLMCGGGIFNNAIIVNFPQCISERFFFNRSIFGEDMGRSLVACVEAVRDLKPRPRIVLPPGEYKRLDAAPVS